MKLVPLGDRVVLKQVEAEETTKSGIVLPGQNKEKPQQAEVVAVGPGGMVDGKEVTMLVSVGDKVIYSKYSGTEVELDGQEYLVVKQSDILAIVK
jgi:chaperonin GroES